MFNKTYEKIKIFIKENYIFITLLLVLLSVFNYPLPYYIYTGGGLIKVDDRVKIENAYQAKGSFHLCYVSEINATLPTYILARILPSWELTKAEDVRLSESETSEDVFNRDRLFLDTGNANAIFVAYQKAGKGFEITGTKNYILYISEEANTNLKIGDNIQSINHVKISNLSDIRSAVSTGSIGDKIQLKVLRNGKLIDTYATIYEEDHSKIIGVMIQSSFDYETNPPIELKFSNSEAGSSGGLLLTLSIYNHLVKTDITHGLKIAGTGTMEQDGTVGEIGGVRHKLRGAVKQKADIFFVPNGDNYNEAMKEKEKNKYKIKIVGVDTFDDALTYLEKIK